jgi:hypothetical protein
MSKAAQENTGDIRGHFGEEGLKVKVMSPAATGTPTTSMNTSTAKTQLETTAAVITSTTAGSTAAQATTT